MVKKKGILGIEVHRGIEGHNTRLKNLKIINKHKKPVLLASRKEEFSPKKVKGLKARG